MGSINKQISRYETTAVYTHPDATVDIILVHGLNGDPQKTWTAKNGVFWPADLLPASLRDARANVLVYGYNADVYSKKHGHGHGYGGGSGGGGSGSSQPSDNFIFMHAQTLVTSLTHYRKDEMTSRNPIVWVCHSLGGILVKRALLYSNDLRASQHEDYRSVYVSTYGIVFLGTPHTGSGIATWGTVLQGMSDAVVPRSFFQTESVLLKTLKRDSETLQNINSHFLDIYQRFKILMAHENHKTDLKGTRMLVVDATSASPQLPGVTYYAIEATHSGMAKFDCKNAPGYRTVATAIREWVSDASEVVATRWRVENDEKLARAQHEIEERMKPWIQSQRLSPSGQGTSTSQQINENTTTTTTTTTNSTNNLPTTQEPSKIQHRPKPMLPPPPETPKTENNDSELFPSQPSQPSGGSEQDSAKDPLFVRPAAFRPNTYFNGRERELRLLHGMLKDRHRRSRGTSSVLIQSMPGGGKSHLARQYIFKHKQDYPGGIFWVRAKTIQELDDGYYDIAKAAGLSDITNTEQDPFATIKAVQAWLSSLKDWLLVLDGIHFDLDGLHYYIPFTKHASIIYTSTERTTGEAAHLFDNPQLLALDPLTKGEAQEMLFEQTGKKKPYTHDDIERAGELVDSMDRLPLMIHVAAQQLNATREPLAKYLRSFKARPKVGNLPAYLAVREQLEHRGAVAALNLMSMLAFFGSHIPVEMIILGTKCLDRSTPVKSTAPGTRKRTLNNTFKTLIAFALIERNEASEGRSSSSRSARSVETSAQDSLDILRIRGIVQAFFVDLIDEERQIHIWLEAAVCVFCGAFDASVDRIERDPQAGMPDDYRRFLMHGRRLLAHVDRFEKRVHCISHCRFELESRLVAAQEKIDLLTKRISEAKSCGTGNAIISVFERTNSMSEDDTETTPSTYSAVDDYDGDDATTTVGSPVINVFTDSNPYHWHVHYPHSHGVVPPVDWDSSSRTETPRPAPTEIFESISMPDDDEVTRRVFGPDHRTIKKHAERRYRDHAGAWRASSQIVSDPRVTISRETAKGLISPITSAQQHVQHVADIECPSEAEVSLNSIQRGPPPQPPQLKTGYTALFGANYSDAMIPSRPRIMAGRPSYANARAEETVWQDEPITPTFSYPPPSSKDATDVIKRLKVSSVPVSLDGLAPIRVSGPPVDMSASIESLASLELDNMLGPEGTLSSSSPPRSPPSRPASGQSAPMSQRSSPSHATGPFRPPPAIPIEINTTSSLRTIPSSASYSDLTTANAAQRLLSYPISEETEHSHSLPTVVSQSCTLPYPHSPHGAVQIPPGPYTYLPGPPAPWVSSLSTAARPSGYSSQPMSRNASHQSGGSNDVGHSSYPGAPRSSELHAHSIPYPPQQSSSPPPMSSPSSFGSYSPGSQVMLRPRSRRPSLVETEPSPRLGGLDGTEGEPVVTSYRLYHDGRERSNPRASRREPRGFDGGSNNLQTESWDHLVLEDANGNSIPVSVVPRPGFGFRARWRSIRSRSWSRQRGQGHGRSVSAAPVLDHVGNEVLVGGEEMLRTGSEGRTNSSSMRTEIRTSPRARSPLAPALNPVGSASSSPMPIPISSRRPRSGSGSTTRSGLMRASPPSGAGAALVGLGIQERTRIG